VLEWALGDSYPNVTVALQITPTLPITNGFSGWIEGVSGYFVMIDIAVCPLKLLVSTWLTQFELCSPGRINPRCSSQPKTTITQFHQRRHSLQYCFVVMTPFRFCNCLLFLGFNWIVNCYLLVVSILEFKITTFIKEKKIILTFMSLHSMRFCRYMSPMIRQRETIATSW
jgi:hypothetical protein